MVQIWCKWIEIALRGGSICKALSRPIYFCPNLWYNTTVEKLEFSGVLLMCKYTIKVMESEDEINGKAYVHYKSWHETYTNLVDSEYMKGITLEKCEKIANKWRENILVAKDGDKVIGFVSYGAYRDNTLCDHGEVYAIYVLKEYHGLKVGYSLMNAALNKLADYKKIAIWVLKDNSKAIRFYERYGFRFDGTDAQIVLGTPNIEQRMIYERI